MCLNIVLCLQMTVCDKYISTTKLTKPALYICKKQTPYEIPRIRKNRGKNFPPLA